MSSSFLNTTTRNVHWLKKAHDMGELHMKPPFQRNPVWVERQKSFLIDTILSGLPIPEVYMQETVSADAEAQYIVVDGQQRLRAVLEFIEGRYTIDAKDSPSWGDMCFDDLSAEDKKKIYQYDFIVRQLPEMDEVQIRKVFQRLNRNVVALNSQELRQATYWGPFINLMNELADWDEWSSFGVFSPNDIRRMIDVEYISEISIAILNGHQNKKAKLDHYYEIYEESFEEGGALKSIFIKTLGELKKILPNISDTRWSKKSDFYTLFLVFAKHHSSLPMSADKRAEATDRIEHFGTELDRFVKAHDGGDKAFERLVLDYGAGIRASTDLGSRKRRFDALETLLANLFDV